MGNVRVNRNNPGDHDGHSLDAGRGTGQHRHVRDVADRARGFRTRRVDMPERGTDRAREKSRQRRRHEH